MQYNKKAKQKINNYRPYLKDPTGKYFKSVDRGIIDRVDLEILRTLYNAEMKGELLSFSALLDNTNAALKSHLHPKNLYSHMDKIKHLTISDPPKKGRGYKRYVKINQNGIIFYQILRDMVKL